jgi:hypothetical protein
MNLFSITNTRTRGRWKVENYVGSIHLLFTILAAFFLCFQYALFFGGTDASRRKWRNLRAVNHHWTSLRKVDNDDITRTTERACSTY